VHGLPLNVSINSAALIFHAFTVPMSIIMLKETHNWSTPQVSIVQLTPSEPTSLLLPGAQLSLITESSGLLNTLLPFLPILDASYPIFDLHLANVLFDAILPSVLGSSL
jgi:hypothetical protein